MIPSWTPLHAAQLRDYLFKTDSGKTLVQSFEVCRPRVTGESPNEVFGEAKIREGWELLAEKILWAASYDEKPSEQPTGIDVSKD